MYRCWPTQYWKTLDKVYYLNWFILSIFGRPNNNFFVPLKKKNCHYYRHKIGCYCAGSERQIESADGLKREHQIHPKNGVNFMNIFWLLKCQLFWCLNTKNFNSYFQFQKHNFGIQTPKFSVEMLDNWHYKRQNKDLLNTKKWRFKCQ